MRLPKSLQGKRVTLVELFPNWKNASTIYKAIKENKTEMKPRLDRAYDINSTRDEYKFLLKKYFSNEIEYGIYVKGVFIGCIGLFNIDEKSNKAELGIWINKEYGGHGYMTEAVRTLIKNIKFTRLEAKIDIYNHKSAQVVSACNFKFEGTMLKYRYSKYMGCNRSMDLYSIIN